MRTLKILPCLLAGFLEIFFEPDKTLENLTIISMVLTSESVLLIFTFDISRISVPMVTREQV